MSQTQSPAPGETLIYPEEVLREKIRELAEVVISIRQLEHTVHENLNSIRTILIKKLPPHKIIEYHEKILSEKDHIKQLVQSAIDILIESALQVDKDVEKYKRLYKVDFKCDNGHVVGVVLVKKGNKVRPVAIATNYASVNYCDRGDP